MTQRDLTFLLLGAITFFSPIRVPAQGIAPATVSVASTISGDVAGLTHACALDSTGAAWCWGSNNGYTSGGTVYCWGSNSAGQLGDGTTTNRNVPTLVVHK